MDVSFPEAPLPCSRGTNVQTVNGGNPSIRSLKPEKRSAITRKPSARSTGVDVNTVNERKPSARSTRATHAALLGLRPAVLAGSDFVDRASPFQSARRPHSSRGLRPALAIGPPPLPGRAGRRRDRFLPRPPGGWPGARARTTGGGARPGGGAGGRPPPPGGGGPATRGRAGLPAVRPGGLKGRGALALQSSRSAGPTRVKRAYPADRPRAGRGLSGCYIWISLLVSGPRILVIQTPSETREAPDHSERTITRASSPLP